MAAGAVSAPLIIPIIHLETHRAKNRIDTRTPVCIQSDTAGALMFFTLDGSKPAAGPRGPAGSSRKYSEPILLPAGRVAVRAVAVTRDGRQSSVVTKFFSVDQVEGEDATQPLLDRRSGSAQNSPGSSLKPPEPRMKGRSPPLSGPGFVNSQQGPGSATWAASSWRSQSAGGGERLSSTQASRIHRETDFLRCAQCLSGRPSDPFARFCARCGAAVPPLPGQKLPPAEAGQMLQCVFCNFVVPVKSETCLICEESTQQQLQPQARIKLQDHQVCACCGSGNPAHMSTCLTCESHLQPLTPNSAPSVPAVDGRTLICSKCRRQNHSDARFCDWCGCKPSHATRCVTCWCCGASGHPYALYCGSCGVFLKAPAPPTASSAHHDATPSPTPAPSLRVTPPTTDTYTQTIGLYYPSATELQKKEQQRELQASRQQALRDRRPPLTAISPGRGYWRKQLDHVCSHLRSYAQNHAPFRVLLGEPRLGRMVSAVVQEDQYEVSLTVSFVSATREQQVGAEGNSGGPGPAGGDQTLSSVMERSAERLGSGRGSGVKTVGPAVSDTQLLKEVGPGGGRVSAVQQLLDQGTDPSCCGSDGRHALAVAVVNGHHDVLPVLVQRGADVDQRSGPMKNTALHEAAALGSGGLQSAQVLLRCNASVRQRNAAGRTAYDVAVNSGSGDMVALLAAQAGLGGPD
ncbi:double zinc ribbon and ankyrin repeat-containing protein 1 [Cololabis saira]|uniref:double zinc ribbon and ankyrin repeat-containing protein 1 n=1 Tax=Cololabis saira TaxID=129043 RepID=UPI002AD378B4|nr:double zinc ribbon and ankyrin repeat-containing protein 1 [Cololabis saira]